MSSGSELKNQYYNWIMKIQFAFLENDLFQPIGLELSCAEIVLETKEDYSFSGIENSDIEKSYFPLAYYRPDTDSIHIFIEHEAFLKRESDFEKQSFLMFLLFHEANHRLLMHEKRGKEKDHELYNIASDMEIHNMFYVYDEIMKTDNKYTSSLINQMTKNYVEDFLFKKTDKNKSEGLFEEEYLQYTAEEIYTILENSKEVEEKEFDLEFEDDNGSSNRNSSNGNSSNGNGNEKESKDSSNSNSSSKSSSSGKHKVKVKKITYKLPNGKTITTTYVEMPKISNKKDDQSEADKEAGALTRKTLMENNLQKKIDEINSDNDHNHNSRGTISNKCKIFLKKLFHVKVDWKKILRNSLQTALEKSEYFSWAQPRTSLFALDADIYLPGQIEDETAYGTVIIARDESGSMSNAECEKAAGIIADSKEYYKKIIVLKHDTVITSVNEVEDLDEEAKKMLLKRNSIGGTSHKDVFKFINKYAKNNEENERISCCIFITDMCSDIEETQDIIPDSIPRIWLTLPSSVEMYKGKVKGKIIPIGL